MAVVTTLPGGVSANASTITVPVTAGLVDGDYRLVLIAVSGSATIATPAGWTLVGASPFVVATTRRIYVFSDYHLGSAPASTTFTLSAANHHVCVYFAVQGHDPTTTIDVNPVAASSDTASNSIVAPSITTTVADTLLTTFHFTASLSASSTQSAPTGMTLIAGYVGNGTNGTSGYAFQETRVSPAATGTRTSTSGSTAQPWGAISFAIRPASTPTIMRR